MSGGRVPIKKKRNITSRKTDKKRNKTRAPLKKSANKANPLPSHGRSKSLRRSAPVAHQAPTTRQSIFELTAQDFQTGSLCLDKPGKYRLTEDIIFHPSSASTEKMDSSKHQRERENQIFRSGKGTFPRSQREKVIFSQPQTRQLTYTLKITADQVHLDLNGFVLQQSTDSLIPYGHHCHIYFSGVTSCLIENGTLGLSSYAGIYGLESQQLLIREVNLIDFETLGIGLVRCQRTVLQDVHLYRNNHQVPVNSAFRHYQALASMLGGSSKGDSQISNLLSEIQHAQATDSKFDWCRTEHGLPDNNCLGIYIGTGLGWEGDLPESPVWCEQILLQNITVNDLQIASQETIGLTSKNNKEGSLWHDPVGGVFSIQPTEQQPLQFDVVQQKSSSSNNREEWQELDSVLIKWNRMWSKLRKVNKDKNKDQDDLEKKDQVGNFSDLMMQKEYGAQRNLNTWGEPLVGLIGIHLDHCRDFKVQGVQIAELINKSRLGQKLENWLQSAQALYTGSQVLGLKIDHCQTGHLLQIQLDELNSYNGSVTGLKIENSQGLTLEKIQLSKLSAGIKDTNGRWIGQGPADQILPQTLYDPNPPNLVPAITGVQVATNNKEVVMGEQIKFQLAEMAAPGAIVPVWQLSN